MAICGVASGSYRCVSRSTASNSLNTFVPRPLIAEFPVPSEQTTMRFGMVHFLTAHLGGNFETPLLSRGRQPLPRCRNRRRQRRDVADPRIDELLLCQQ